MGETITGNEWHKTEPRKWTAEEVEWAVARRSEGHSVKAIAIALDRSYVSVRLKMTRQMKTAGEYNQPYRMEKYEANKQLLEATGARSALDVYAGDSWWANNLGRVLSNDLDPAFETDHNMDAFQFLVWVTSEQRQYDIVDLDPFGSPYECLDLAMKIATKGLAVSFGEWGMKRWNRTDYVQPRYGISSPEEYQDGRPFIEEVQRIARCNGKIARPIAKLQYHNFLRVNFTLEKRKTTEQWTKGDTDA